VEEYDNSGNSKWRSRQKCLSIMQDLIGSTRVEQVKFAMVGNMDLIYASPFVLQQILDAVVMSKKEREQYNELKPQ